MSASYSGHHLLPAGAVSFTDWLEEKVGTRFWCVAPRLGKRLRAHGYDRAIPKARYAALWREWERETFGAPLDRLHDAAPALLAALRLIARSDGFNGGSSVEELQSIARAAVAQLDTVKSK